MNYKLCFSKKLIILYCIIGVPIIYGSFANLMNIINDTGSVIGLGAFSLGGFILLPMMIYFGYKHNICVINLNGVTNGKNTYPFSNYKFEIDECRVPLKDRSLIALTTKTTKQLVIKNKNTQKVFWQVDLNIFNSDLKKLKKILSSHQS